MDWGVKACISSSIAALVAIAVSLAVDYLGGRAAGVIGTVPHVAVVGSLSFFVVLEQREFEVALLSMLRSMHGFIGPADIFRNPESIFRFFEPTTGGTSSNKDMIDITLSNKVLRWGGKME